MKKRPSPAAVGDAIHLLVELVPGVLLSMLVDHGDECICHESARVLLSAAGITPEHFAELWVASLGI